MSFTKKKNLRRFLAAALCLITVLALTGCAAQPKQISSLSDLSDGRIVTAMGVFDRDAAANDTRLENAAVDYAISHENALAELTSGKADAMATDYITAKITAASTPGVKLLDEKFDSSEYVFVLPAGSALLPELNSAIAEMKKDGTVDRLIDIWTGSVESRKIILTATWDGSAGTIRCCISPDAKALCYTDGTDSLAGAEVNLIYLLAERMNRKVTFSVCDSADLPAAAASGDCDIAFGGIKADGVSRGDVALSDAYLEGGTAFLVRADSAPAPFAERLTTGFYRFFLENDRWRDLLSGVGTSLVLTILSTVFSILLGILYFLWTYSGSKAGQRIVSAAGRLIGLLPIPAWLLIVYYGIFANSSASSLVIAITAFSILYSFNVYGALSGAMASISAGQKEAVEAMGYGKFTALRRIYLPQIIPAFLGSLEGMIIGNVLLCALSEFIFVSDFQAVSDAIRAQTLDPFFPIAFNAVFYVIFAYGFNRLIHLLNLFVTSRLSKTETSFKKELSKGGGR